MKPSSLSRLDEDGQSAALRFLKLQTIALLEQNENAATVETLRIPMVDATALDGPAPTVVDSRALVHGSPALRSSLAGLPQLEAAEALRETIESMYGVRLTFRGEDRERTGARIEVRQDFGTVSGRATGVRAAELPARDVEVVQRADEIATGGAVIGVHLGDVDH